MKSKVTNIFAHSSKIKLKIFQKNSSKRSTERLEESSDNLLKISWQKTNKSYFKWKKWKKTYNFRKNSSPNILLYTQTTFCRPMEKSFGLFRKIPRSSWERKTNLKNSIRSRSFLSKYFCRQVEESLYKFHSNIINDSSSKHRWKTVKD